jgi:hypothetical protein
MIIVSTTLYFLSALIHEIKSTAKKKKTRREMLWARIKSNSAKIRGMKGLKNITKNNSPFSLSNFGKKNDLSVKDKRSTSVMSLKKVVPTTANIPHKERKQEVLRVPGKPVSSESEKINTEENLSSLSSSLSSSRESELTSSSSEDDSTSLSSENSDEELRHLLRSEVTKINTTTDAGNEVSLITLKHNNRIVSDDESSTNHSDSTSPDEGSGRLQFSDSDSTSDDDAPTL